jgi:hypothetical protein
MFLWLFSFKNAFAENHGLLSGIDFVTYVINQTLKLCWIQMEMGGVYAMVQPTGHT